jgi:hypothetical protein
VQLYSEPTFKQELAYSERSAGIAITDRQFIFPLAGNPQNAAENFRLKLVANNRFSSAKKLKSKRLSEIIASN